MSASNKLFNVILIGALGLVGVFASLFLLLGSDRAVSALYETGMERLEAGDHVQAKRAFERALDRSDNKAPAAFQLALLTAREDPPAAMRYVRLAMDEGRPTGTMYAQMVRLAVRGDELDLATALLDRLQHTDPSHDELLTLRGLLAVKRNQFPEAISIFEEIYSTGGASSEVTLILGQLLSRSSTTIDRTRAKVILMETARDDNDHAKNALLYIVGSGTVQMEARDWTTLMQIGAERDFLTWAPVRDNLPLLRRLMLIAGMHYRELAGEIAEVRAAHPDADAVDFLDAAAMAQKNRALRRAEAYLEMVPEAEQDSLRARIVRAHQIILEGRPGVGVPILEEANEEAPEDLSILAMLRDLAKMPEGILTVREQITILEMITHHPYATLHDQLSSYRLLIGVRPLQSRRILEEVRDRLGEAAPGPVGQWFLDQEEPEFTLEVVPPEKARTNGNFFELRLLALLSAGRIEEAEEMVANRPAAIPSSLVVVARLRVAMAREDDVLARELWAEAVELSDRAGSQQGLPILARMALRFDAEDLALEGFDRAYARGAQMSEQDWSDYTRLAGANRSLERQLRVAQAARLAYPENADFINNAAYLELLAGLNVRENLQRMERIVEGHPEEDGYRVTLALAYLRSNRPSLAVRTVERVDLDWSPAGASAQAIYIASLAEGNQRPMAENFVKNVDTSSLLNEEYQLIQSLLNRQ